MSTVYPPPGHFLRYLGITQDGSSARLGARPDLCSGGRVGLGAVAAMVDVLAGWVVMDAVAPDWGATLDLSIHTDGPFVADVIGEATVLRAGGRTVVVEVELRSGDRAGRSMVTYSRLERRDVNPSASPQLPSIPEPVADEISSVADFLAVTRLAAPGELRLDRIASVQNSIGAYNGGAIAALADLSACHFAANAADVSAEAVSGIDMTINYLSAARTGPLVASPDLVSLRSNAATVKVALYDRGNEDRTAAVITETVRW